MRRHRSGSVPRFIMVDFVRGWKKGKVRAGYDAEWDEVIFGDYPSNLYLTKMNCR